MKILYKRIISFVLSFEIFIMSFYSCTFSVYAADFMPTDIVAAVEYGIESSDWQPFYRFLYNSSDGLMFLVSQMGAFVKKDFQTWVDNNKKLESFANTVPAKKEGNNIVFTKDFMIQLKALIDDYAKEHEPYFMGYPYVMNLLPNTAYCNQRNVYDSINNLLNDSPSGIIGFACISDSTGVKIIFTDIGVNYTDTGLVHFSDYYNVHYTAVKAYGIDTWNHCNFPRYELTLKDGDPAIQDRADLISRAGTAYTAYSQYLRFYCALDNEGLGTGYKFGGGDGLWTGNQVASCLLSKDLRRIRVFNTYGDFQNYTLGKRSVYYTKEYYSYVPEDLTASVEDLQQSVDDLSGVLDQLLGQITKDTDESEVEDLLQQILDELKNQQGIGGGSGSGGSDVSVNVDLSYTNSLLERIHLQLRSIWDEIHKQLEEMKEDFRSVFIFEDAPGINLKYIASLLERMLAQLRRLSFESEDEEEKEDDGIFDLDDMLKGILEDPETGSKEAADSLSESFGDVAAGLTKKFPISIPWDLYALFSVLADIPSSPEQTAQAIVYDDRGIMLDAAYTQGNIQLLAATPSVTTYRAARASDSPYFELPIYIESYGINETITVDLDRFKPLSTFSRTLFAIIFGVLLLKWTIAFISAFNEVMPDFFSSD